MLRTGQDWRDFVRHNARLIITHASAEITRRNKDAYDHARDLVASMQQTAGTMGPRDDLKRTLLEYVRKEPEAFLEFAVHYGDAEPVRFRDLMLDVQSALIAAVLYSLAQDRSKNKELEDARMDSYHLPQHQHTIIDTWCDIAKDSEHSSSHASFTSNAHLTALKFLDLKSHTLDHPVSDVQHIVSTLLEVSSNGKEQFKPDIESYMNVPWADYNEPGRAPVAILPADSEKFPVPELMLLSAPKLMRFAHRQLEKGSANGISRVDLYPPMRLWEYFATTQSLSRVGELNPGLAKIIYAMAEAVVVHEQFPDAFPLAKPAFAAISDKAQKDQAIYDRLPRDARDLIAIGSKQAMMESPQGIRRIRTMLQKVASNG